MTGASHGVSEPSAFWPTFSDRQTIAGIKLLDLVDWVRASDRVLGGGGDAGPKGMPVIAMPPVQRTAVWRPKQVLDLWDSLMRGLPIGAFYLVDRPAGGHKHKLVRLGANSSSPARVQESTLAGFDLLDGQQRVRALLAGIHGPAGGTLCLWVDLGDESAGQHPCLRATSKAQPFGYDGRSGGKLRMDQRRAARRAIEPDPDAHPLRCGDRPAYDLDLFDGPVTLANGGKEPIKRPRPFDATEKTVALHSLLAAWRDRPRADVDAGVAALRDALPQSWSKDDTQVNSALRALDQAFQRVRDAQVALLRVDPDQKTLLTLFERIGAGGTPLSLEERLFSIYKHHVPEIRDVVNAIHDKAGRVLPPTKIVAAALRIANARRDRPQYTIPSARDFAEEMAAKSASELWQKLDRLMPNGADLVPGRQGLLGDAFVAVRRMLSQSDEGGTFWMPDAVLAVLPAELWDVLVFWAIRILEAGRGEDLATSREEVVRFALFWHVFGWNNEKSARWAFEYLNGVEDATRFPGLALYQQLVGNRDDCCACALIDAGEFTQRLLSKERSSSWRTDRERFDEGKKRNEVGAHWWWSGRKVLPWLQRDYIVEAFPGYRPLSDHEDDLPYDVDHICPWKDCGDWFSVGTRIAAIKSVPGLERRMRDGRDAVGNGIGNLRLVSASDNKGDRDADISEKMPFAVEDNPSEKDQANMAKFAMPPEDRALWKQVSRSGNVAERQWDEHRLAAFQQAVEKRATWLYCCFYHELGYAAWVSETGQDVASGEKA